MQWLKQLQDDRRKVDEKKEIEEQQKLKRRSEFMEREAKKRLLKKASKEETFCEADIEESSLSSLPPQWSATPSISGAESSSVKPAWCQSEAAMNRLKQWPKSTMKLISWILSMTSTLINTIKTLNYKLLWDK